MDAETGGTPDGFRSRTVLARVPEMAASGLKGAVVIQGVDDGLVTYDQSQQFQAALRAFGVPVHYFTATLRDAATEKETTISGYAGDQVDGDYRSPLVGHASERSTTHVVSRLGFERLYAIFDGDAPACHRAHVVADGAVTPPLRPCFSV